MDLIVFYLFFEGQLDPDVPDHRHLGRGEPGLCAFKFFLYTCWARC